jgi:hypothetical protein
MRQIRNTENTVFQSERVNGDHTQTEAILILISYPITGLDRPFGLNEVEPPRISTQSAHEIGMVVSNTHININ